MGFEAMKGLREAQILRDGVATDPRLREAVPEPVGAPVPGAMAMLALTACLVSMVLGVCRAFGAVDWSAVWLLSPIWGSALLVALVAACSAAVAWARSRP